MSWNFVRMLIIIISRSSLKLGHVGLKTRSLDQQATQVSDLGPLWPSCFRKRWFFMKYFKLVHAPIWKIPQYMKFFYSYVQDIQSSESSTFLRYLRLLNALEGTLFWKKMIFSWNISSWCMPKFDRFLIIWNEFYSYVQGKKHLVSSTIFVYLRLSYALYGTFFFEKKRWFFMNYFKFVHAPNLKIFLIIWQVFYPYVQGKKHWVSSTCPNLKDSLLYDRFSIHMYKARSIWYLQQFSSICVSLMPCTVHFLEKDDFSWNISSWCRPQLERFLIIWQVFYPYVQGIKHSVSSTIFLSLGLPHTQ